MGNTVGFVNFSRGQGGSAISHALGSEATRSSWRDALNILPMLDGTARIRQGSKYLTGYGFHPAGIGVNQYSGGIVGARFTISLRDPYILIRDDETGATIRFDYVDLSQIEGNNVQFTPITAPDDILVTNRGMPPIRIYRVDGVWTYVVFNINTQTDKIYDTVNGKYPACAAVHDGRLWLGGNPSYPGFFWGSRSKNVGGGYKDFTFGVNDSDAVEFRVDGSAANILSMTSRDGLLLVSEDGFRIATSEGPIITPSDIQIRQQSNVPVADARFAPKGNLLVHIATSGRAIHLSFFNWQNNAWTTNTEEPVDESLLDGEKFIQVAVVEEYFDTIWALSDSGRLFCFQILGEGKYSWSKHDVGGHVHAISAQVGAVGSGLILWVQRGDEAVLERISREDTEHAADCWVEMNAQVLPSAVRQPGCIVRSEFDQTAYEKYIGSAVTPDAIIGPTVPPVLPEPTGTTESGGTGDGDGGGGGSGIIPEGTGGDSGTIVTLPIGFPWNSVSLPNHTFSASIPNVPVEIVDLGVYHVGQPPGTSPDTVKAYLSRLALEYVTFDGTMTVSVSSFWVAGVVEIPKNALYNTSDGGNPFRGVNFEVRSFQSDGTQIASDLVPLMADGGPVGAQGMTVEFDGDNSAGVVNATVFTPQATPPLNENVINNIIDGSTGGNSLPGRTPDLGPAKLRTRAAMADSADDAYYIYFSHHLEDAEVGLPGSVDFKIMIAIYNDRNTIGVTHAMDANFLPKLITVNAV